MSDRPGDVRVMLVDDSAVIRRLLTRVLDTVAGITVVGQAEDGAVALERLDVINPDVVVLDIEMPRMDGLATLPELRARRATLPVIMFSTLTERGASATLEALTRGADDYVTKPSNTGSFDVTAQQIRTTLVPKIKALHERRRGWTTRSRTPAAARATRPPSASPSPGAAAPTSPPHRTSTRPIELITIGVSTGGPGALAALVPNLPATLGVPVLVTQHMPPIFTRLLAERLDAQSALRVAEATDGVEPRAGEVWFAPGGSHLLVRRTAGRLQLVIDDGPPVHSCKPAVDPLFDSAVAAVGDGVLGVILTGMGNDGLEGCRGVVAHGGLVLCQDEPSSTVWGMPGAVARAGLAHRVLPLDDLAQAVVDATAPPLRPRRGALAPARS